MGIPKKHQTWGIVPSILKPLYVPCVFELLDVFFSWQIRSPKLHSRYPGALEGKHETPRLAPKERIETTMISHVLPTPERHG